MTASLLYLLYDSKSAEADGCGLKEHKLFLNKKAPPLPEWKAEVPKTRSPALIK